MKNMTPALIGLLLFIFPHQSHAETITLSATYPPSGNYGKLAVGTGAGYTSSNAGTNNILIEGNVGIGTTAVDAQKLDVWGKLAINGVQALSTDLNDPTSIIAGNSNAIFAGNSRNTVIGMDIPNIAGSLNTTIGYSTLASATGTMNTAIGASSLLACSGNLCNYNTVLGAQAISFNTNGEKNTAVGYLALRANVSNKNTAVGFSAAGTTITGSENLAFGTWALQLNASGSNNTAYGYSTLQLNSTQSNNVAVGVEALWRALASSNTTIGHRVFNHLTSGNNNIGIGEYAGANNGLPADQGAIKAGTGNITIGTSAMPPNGDLNDQLAIGNLLYGSNIYTMGAGSLGIGSTAPSARLDVAGNVISTDATVTGALLLKTNTGDTAATLKPVPDPAAFEPVGLSPTILTINRPVIITGNILSGSDAIALTLDQGMTAAHFFYNSDARLKTDIRTVTGALKKIEALNGVTFAFRSTPRKIRTGLIAQNVETVVPETVSTDHRGMKSVAYGNLVGLLIEGIKDQQKQIDILEQRLKKLEEQP